MLCLVQFIDRTYRRLEHDRLIKHAAYVLWCVAQFMQDHARMFSDARYLRARRVCFQRKWARQIRVRHASGNAFSTLS